MFGNYLASIPLLVLSLMPLQSPSAYQHPAACPPGEAPAFSFGIARLHTHLGLIMGEPMECEHTDPTSGRTMQQTTTGLALYRSDTNTPMFTNGREHWALTPDGVAHWSGWHGEAGVFAAPAQEQGPNDSGALAASQVAPARVEVVTIVDVFDGADPRFVIRSDELPYLLRVDGSCVMHRFLAGSVVFVVSPDEVDGRIRGLLVTLDGVECRITDEQAL